MSENFTQKDAVFSIADTNYVLTEKQTFALSTLCNPSKKFIKLWGGARSGKTFLNCLYILRRAIKYKNSTHLIARYSKQSAKSTVWRQEMLPLLRRAERANWCKINYTESYAEFVNGSMILLGGLRPSDISSILSSEYQTIFVCEANENAWNVIELVMTRLNGTQIDKTGNIIDLKFLIDLNPQLNSSWSNFVWLKGLHPNTQEKMINYTSYAHVHFVPMDNIKHLADGYISDLKAMSESKRKRFLLGEYGTHEGLVYDKFGEKNIVEDFEISEDWQRCLGVDFGFTHPFVCIEACVSNDECVYITKEYVQTQRTVREHSEKIKKHFTNDKENINKKYDFIVCDHDAEDMATLRENQITNLVRAYKKVNAGIERMQDFIERNKLKVFRSCTTTISEFESYRWKDKENTKDRDVEKQDDHCMDAARYIIMKLYPAKLSVSVGRIGFYK